MMTFLAIYLVISLVIGLIFTLMCWEADRKAKGFETFVTFVGMTASFAFIWPLMAIVILGK